MKPDWQIRQGSKKNTIISVFSKVLLKLTEDARKPTSILSCIVSDSWDTYWSIFFKFSFLILILISVAIMIFRSLPMGSEYLSDWLALEILLESLISFLSTVDIVLKLLIKKCKGFTLFFHVLLDISCFSPLGFLILDFGKEHKTPFELLTWIRGFKVLILIKPILDLKALATLKGKAFIAGFMLVSMSICSILAVSCLEGVERQFNYLAIFLNLGKTSTDSNNENYFLELLRKTQLYLFCCVIILMKDGADLKKRLKGKHQLNLSLKQLDKNEIIEQLIRKFEKLENNNQLLHVNLLKFESELGNLKADLTSCMANTRKCDMKSENITKKQLSQTGPRAKSELVFQRPSQNLIKLRDKHENRFIKTVLKKFDYSNILVKPLTVAAGFQKESDSKQSLYFYSKNSFDHNINEKGGTSEKLSEIEFSFKNSPLKTIQETENEISYSNADLDLRPSHKTLEWDIKFKNKVSLDIDEIKEPENQPGTVEAKKPGDRIRILVKSHSTDSINEMVSYTNDQMSNLKPSLLSKLFFESGKCHKFASERALQKSTKDDSLFDYSPQCCGPSESGSLTQVFPGSIDSSKTEKS